MADLLHVATRKGLFELARRNGGWEVVDIAFLGDPVSAVLATADGNLLAALDLGHFGAKLWRREGAGAWREMAVPAFPPKPDRAHDDPHPWSLGKLWVFESGGVGDRLWAGTMPGGLFRSDDGGASWSLNEALWLMPERRQWTGVAGGEQPGIHSILVDPRNPADIRVGVSTAGVRRPPMPAPPGGSSTGACTPSTCLRNIATTPSSRTSTDWPVVWHTRMSFGASTTMASSGRKMAGQPGVK